MAITNILSGIKTVSGLPQKGRDYVDDLINKKVLKPKGVKGIGGFVFDVDREANVKMTSEVTDHFVEDNTHFNDHIALKPKRIILSGFVGEIVEKKETGLLGLISGIQNKLGVIPAYLGDYTPQQLNIVQGALTKAKETVQRIDDYLAKIKNIVGALPIDLKPPTKQQQAYSELRSLWETKQVFFVETPFEIFENMTIEDVTLIQDETTKTTADVTVTLKQMRFVSTEETQFNAEAYSGRAQQQRQGQVDKGVTDGKPIENFSSVLTGGGGILGQGVKKLMNGFISATK